MNVIRPQRLRHAQLWEGASTCFLQMRTASRISALSLLTFVVKMAAEELLGISEPVYHVACLTLAFPAPPPPVNEKLASPRG